MGCVFCKKVEPGPKEDVGLEGDFRSYGASDRYGPDPTQARPMSSLAHIPNYNNFSPQPTSPAFLEGSTIRAITGEFSSWRQAQPRPWRREGVDLSLGASSMARETALLSACTLRTYVKLCPQGPPSEGETQLCPSLREGPSPPCKREVFLVGRGRNW